MKGSVEARRPFFCSWSYIGLIQPGALVRLILFIFHRIRFYQVKTFCSTTSSHVKSVDGQRRQSAELARKYNLSDEKALKGN